MIRESKYKAVIFDMDGLMIDTERLYIETEKEMAKIFGKQVSEETLWKMMGRKPEESLEIFKNDLNIPLSVNELLRFRNEKMIKRMETDLKPMNGLVEILLYLYPRFKLAIATGAPKSFVDIMLNKFALYDYFEVIQTSEDIKNGKPNPEIYIKTCEKLNLPSHECIVLEDSSNGVKSAKEAGCYVIAIPSIYTNKQDFSKADKTVDNLIDAMNWIAYINEGF